MGGSRGPYLVRLIVAAYLIYLGFKLVRDMATGAGDAENPVLFTIIGIAFIGVAAFLIVRSVQGLMRAQKEEREAREAEEAGEAGEAEAEAEPAAIPEKAEEAAEPEAEGPMSISERIRLLSEGAEEEEGLPEEEAAESEE